MNEFSKKAQKKCCHKFDITDYGIFHTCGNCGRSYFQNFDPYIYQRPPKDYVVDKLEELEKAFKEMLIYKQEMLKYLKHE